MENYMNESFNMEECFELHQNKVEVNRSALKSLLKELLDEKISTQKKNHWVLGPEDLNETVHYDFEVEDAA